MNLMFFIVLGSLLCVVVRAQETCEKLDFSKVDRISSKLDKFLDRYQREQHANFRKVLKKKGKTFSKVYKNEPLESYVLQNQIAMHKNLKYYVKKLTTTIKNLRLGKEKKAKKSTFKYVDCYELRTAGNTESKVYTVYPLKDFPQKEVSVFCDMSTSGGGWTVFLSRKEVSEQTDFNRNWDDYKKGFGRAGEEHWLGNDILHSLTHHRSYILRMEAEDEDGRNVWGEWNLFKVDNEEAKYALHVSYPNALNNAYDIFLPANKKSFSTYDNGNDLVGDKSKKRCAEVFKGGWWYSACYLINPTGIYGQKDGTGIELSHWSNTDQSARYATTLSLKIRPFSCQ